MNLTVNLHVNLTLNLHVNLTLNMLVNLTVILNVNFTVTSHVNLTVNSQDLTSKTSQCRLLCQQKSVDYTLLPLWAKHDWNWRAILSFLPKYFLFEIASVTLYLVIIDRWSFFDFPIFNLFILLNFIISIKLFSPKTLAKNSWLKSLLFHIEKMRPNFLI